jgi:hypothetical protein
LLPLRIAAPPQSAHAALQRQLPVMAQDCEAAALILECGPAEFIDAFAMHGRAVE